MIDEELWPLFCFLSRPHDRFSIQSSHEGMKGREGAAACDAAGGSSMPEPVITDGQAEHEAALRLKNPVSSVCERRAPLQFPAADLVRGDTIAANLDVFADVSRILVKRILDMQE